MNITNEAIFQINKFRGLIHWLGQIRRAPQTETEAISKPASLNYHTFLDLGVNGIFDVSEHLHKYQFPNVRGMEILDAGCASGFFSRHLRLNGAYVTSLDIKTDAVENLNSVCNLGLNIVNANVFSLLGSASYDLVFCGSLLLHVNNPVALLEKLFNELKPGGKLILASASIKSRKPIAMLYTASKARAEGSTDDAIWWLSPAAQINMLKNAGFSDCREAGSFVLHSTRYACARGYRCSLRHTVYHATK